MAENQWGPKPFVKPPPSVFPASAFWGPAEVPDQVRGQPRVDSWVNKDYSWEAPARDSVQAGPHDSWVAPVIKQHFFSEPGVGSQNTEGNFRAGFREQNVSGEGTSIAGNRPQGVGDPQTFIAPIVEQSNPSAPGEGSQDTEGNFRAGFREQGTSPHETYIAPIVEQSNPSAPGEGSRYGGENDTWVAPVLKQFFPSAPGEGEHTTEGNFIANHRPQKGTGANPLNPFVRIQGVSDNDSWIAPIIGQQFLSEPGVGSQDTEGNFIAGARPQKGDAHDSWVDPVIKQYFPSEPGEGSWYGGENDTWRDPVNDQDFESTAGTPTRYNGVAESFVGGLVRTQGVGDKSTKKLDKYLGAWNFEAEIDGISSKLNFLTVSGVNSESEPIEFKFGTDGYKRSLPGVAKFGEVELTRYHQVGSDDLRDWRNSVEKGFIDVRNITLRLKHVDNKTVAFSMTLHDCWPFKWDAPEMNAGGTEGAIEKISFKVARVTKEVGAPGFLGQIAGFISSLIR